MTIGYNRLGSNGRLGNQMFQYAALLGIAAHKGYDWVIPPFEGYGDSNYGLFDCFHFSQEFFDNCPDNINLHDYFTTEKYFKNIEDLIRNDFEFKDEILTPCKEIFDDLKNPIFLHVRRSDYISSQVHHPLCSLQYYENALKHFDESSPVLVFSDDIEWCKDQELFYSDRFMLSEYQEKYPQKSDTNNGKQNALIPYFDLCMMTLCTGGIIANSTLSWWGAWLIENPTQPIIAPDPWFGPGYKHYIMDDLLPKNWIKVES
jgi:hypothetical protein